MVSESTTVDEPTGSGGPPDQEKSKVFDKWLVWGLAILSIALPMLFLMVVSSVDSASIDFTDLREAAGHGEFLIPDAFLLIECSRRLIREVSPKRFVFKLTRALIIALCAICATICLVASVILVVRATGKTAEAATWITLRCLLLGVVAGTIAVWAKDSER